MRAASLDPGSFRDPAGQVYLVGNRVLRTISAQAVEHYTAARDRGLLRRHVDQGTLIDSREVDRSELAAADGSVVHVVEHPRIPFVSYPYEWSFALLKRAALFHLDFQCALLDDGFVLSDASAYNVQYVGSSPIFIDLLSIRKYSEGDYWLAHNQFCEQFLNPLLLGSWLGVPHNDWFRGRLEGIPSSALTRLLPWYRKLSPRALTHVVGPARLQARNERRHAASIVRRPLPASAYRALLRHLRRWIGSLEPANTGTAWQDYDSFHTYSAGQEQAKKDFVGRFVAEHPPRVLWDLGCNTGEYSEVALRAGAVKVIGFDFDHGALNRALARAEAHRLDLLPLYLDGANPSPNQGWAQRERSGLHVRRNADAIMALAFVHHLAIGRNIPLPEVVGWLTDLAPRGLIEFVQKDDPTVREMLALREDVFARYDEATFLRSLQSRARIGATQRNPENGRLLVVYERH